MTGMWTVAAAALLLMLPAAHAATVPTAMLADLWLEQLANIEITSVSRRPEPPRGTPASVYVITADDIRRSGATQQDVMFEDVERIEVISGPAPAVWGTNAVNGVRIYAKASQLENTETFVQLRWSL